MRLLLLLLICGMALGVHCGQCRTRQCRKQGRYLRQSLKLTEDPCEDFYSFACGNFAKHHEVPPGTLGWGPFEMADNATTYALKAILEEPSRASDFDALKKAKRMYSACMDTDTRDDRGLKPLLHMIRRAGGWPVISDEWQRTVTWHHVAKVTARYGIPLFFNMEVKRSSENSSTNVIVLDAPTMRLQMPVRRENLAVDLMALPLIKDTILRFLVDVATEILGKKHPPVEDQIKEVLEMARKLQSGKSFSQELYDSEVTVSYLNSKYKDIDWLDFLRTCFQYSGVTISPEDIVQVTHWAQLDNILEVFKSASSRLRANYMISRLVLYLAPETTKRMHQHLIQLYHDLEIIPTNYFDWQYCINKVQDFPDLGLGGVLAHKFMKYYFRRGKFQRAQALVNDVRKASDELLGEINWIDTNTMQLIKQKSREMKVYFGFRPWMKKKTELNRFYSELKILKRDHFGNVLRLRRFMQAKNMAILSGGHHLETSWSARPFVVNAFYEIAWNSVILPGGVMQFPFYSGQYRDVRTGGKMQAQRDKESMLMCLDYGRLGSLVGHEMSHAFDDSGHMYDKNGKIGNRWLDMTEIKYWFRSRCFSRQYNKSLLFDRTLGENIADNGGVRRSYRAFKMAWARERGNVATLPGLPPFTPEQLFFLGYATTWCYVGEEHAADVHSSHRDRVIHPLSNMPEFSAAWNCTSYATMNPHNKCILL